MNDLCTDIGYKSINHFGEQLCGDHVDVVKQSDGSTVVVLADGLGSGVKASILSTLTSKIISTMIASGLNIEDCVKTIAQTLPLDKQRGVAYSTFSIIHIKDNEVAELYQYDNPDIILLRNGENWEYSRTEMTVYGKTIYKSRIRLQEDDIFIAMSDGCPHAGIGNSYNFGWKREDIISFMSAFSYAGYTAKTLSTILVDECNRLYENKPYDDVTACTIKIRKREPLNILFGPPANKDDDNRMLSLYFSKAGKHIICGGTTSTMASKYLRKPITVDLTYQDDDIPPIAKISGVDLVTEGVITINRVLEYAKDYIGLNELYDEWSTKRDGASIMSRILFEEATDINFYVGRAINPSHQNPDLPINFSIKMKLVEELSKCLSKMGKNIKTLYY